LEAAEKVDKFAAEDKFGVFDLLSQLVDKSLVLIEDHEHAVRYGMLETVRQYGMNKLSEEGEIEAIRQQHANYFVELAEEVDPGLRDERQIRCLEILDAEHDNLRGALRRSINKGNADLAFRLVSALGWFWFMRGYWKESWNWLHQSLDMSTDAKPILRAKAAYKAGGLEIIRGKTARTTELVEEALQICREKDDKEGVAWCLNLLGQTGTWGHKDIDEAENNLSESCDIFKKIEDKWGQAWSLRYLGQVAGIKGDYERSIELKQDALNRFEEIGDIWNSAHSLYDMGISMNLHGDFQEAGWAFKQSLEKCELVEDKVMAAHAIRGLGFLALQEDSLDQAEQLSQDALEALQKIGDDNCAAHTMRYLGEIARRRGDFTQASDYLYKSLMILQELGNEHPIVITLERFAALAGSLGDDAKAAKLLAAINEHVEDSFRPYATLLRDHNELISSTQMKLGNEEFEQLWAEGVKMELNDAIALAVEKIRAE
jgi:tetratricopeptide (TPR) repeat protein